MSIEELKKEISRNMCDTAKDFCGNWSALHSHYICDAISEEADSLVDIYYSDRAKWFANNWTLVDEAIAEFGNSGSIMQDIAQAQFLQAHNELYEDLENIILFLAYEYLEGNGFKELTEEQAEIIEDITSEIDSNNRLEDIADYLTKNILNADERSSAE